MGREQRLVCGAPLDTRRLELALGGLGHGVDPVTILHLTYGKAAEIVCPPLVGASVQSVDQKSRDFVFKMKGTASELCNTMCAIASFSDDRNAQEVHGIIASKREEQLK